MNKSKSTTNKIGKYLREISVVVIGVAITLSLSYWIGIKNEERDIALHLNAIKIETEDNMKVLEEVIEYLQPSIRYADYLKSHDKESLNRDTIDYYLFTVYNSRTFSFKINALEMFKNSGIMRLVTDKDLLLSIWDVYTDLIELKTFIDWCHQVKWEDLKKELSMIEQGTMNLKAPPMYAFYCYTDIPHSLLRGCEDDLKKSREMLLKFEEMKMMKQFETSEFKPAVVIAEDLDKYLGVYSSDQVPLKLTVTKISNQLIAQATGQRSFPLDATAEDKFEFRPAGVILEFNPTDKTVILKQGGKIFNFVREN